MYSNISIEDYEKLKSAIAAISILIAGADGEIDKKEKAWASRLTDIRSFSHKEALRQFYKDVDAQFEEKLDQLLETTSDDKDEREVFLSEMLSELNPILAKMENEVAFTLYESLKSFAEHIAKASGGFLRFASVSKEEKKLISLPMIDEIILEEWEE